MTIFSDLSLYPANSEQVLESRRRTFHQWGSGHTFEEYMEREELTDRHEVAQNGRFVTWILAPRESWNSFNFLCSCETFRRNALSIQGLSGSTSGKRNFPKDISGYGIASVYTPDANRGRGYARHMMRLLHWVLAPESSLPVFPAEWGDPPPRVSTVGDASLSVLFSDVGETFYRQAGTLPDKEDGWVIADPISTTWEVAESYKLVFPEEAQPRFRWRLLDEELVRDIWDKDAKIMKEELEFCSSTSHTTNFTFLPDSGVAEFQYHQLRFIWNKMNPQPVYWGVCLQGGKDDVTDASTFATWTLDVRTPSNALIITRIRAQPEDFQELFVQIISFAKRHSIEMIEVWNLPSNLRDIGHRFGGKTFSREEHLPLYKWYGGECHEELLWLNNEKFCWC